MVTWFYRHRVSEENREESQAADSVRFRAEHCSDLIYSVNVLSAARINMPTSQVLGQTGAA